MSPENTLKDLLELKRASGFSGIPITGESLHSSLESHRDPHKTTMYSFRPCFRYRGNEWFV